MADGGNTRYTLHFIATLAVDGDFSCMIAIWSSGMHSVPVFEFLVQEVPEFRGFFGERRIRENRGLI